MAALEAVTWKCHVCGDDRPDDKIGVFTSTEKIGIPGMEVPVTANVRHCNDRSKCCAGAADVAARWLHLGEERA